MGIRYRKSINLGGGFRVNVSKSGIGYSLGVKGARVTKTATGRSRTTISIPGTGLSYVSESGKKGNNDNSHTVPKPEDSKIPNYVDMNSVTDLVNYETLDSGIYSEAIKEVVKWRGVSTALIMLSILLIILSLVLNPLLILLGIASLIVGIVVRYKLGVLRVIYELDAEAENKYKILCDAWNDVCSSKSVFQVSKVYKTVNNKNTFGADKAIDPVIIKKPLFRQKPDVKTNIKPFIIPIVSANGFGQGQIILLPDRVLISSGNKMYAVENSQIKTTCSIQPMAITDNSVPKDAYVAEYRHIHSNRDGTADARYKDNPSFPVVHYGRIDLNAGESTILAILISDKNKVERRENELSIETTLPSVNPVQMQQTTPADKFCTNCGNRVQIGSKYCSSCGELIVEPDK